MTVTARYFGTFNPTAEPVDAAGDRDGAHARISTEPGLRFDLVTSRDAFDDLEGDWNALFERSGRPEQVFQTFNWCWHWANHYLATSPGGVQGVSLCIVTARRHGRLIMVWPLVTERMRGVTQIFWMGEPVSQSGDILIDPVPDALDIMRSAWRFLRSKKPADLLRLRHVRSDAKIAPLLGAIGATMVDSQVAPFMNLGAAANFAAFEERYSAKARKNRRRLLRRFEEKGSAEFVRVRGGSEARALAVQAVQLKARWLEDRGLVSTAVVDQRMSRLFGDLAEQRAHPVDCVISALKTNGNTAAVEVSFVCKARLSMHLIAFNLAHEKSGAGVLLLEQSLKDGFDERLDIYDMLAPGDAYKFEWCSESARIEDWVKPMSATGFMYGRVYLGLMRERLKASMKRLPDGTRQILTRVARVLSVLSRTQKPAIT